MTDAGTGATMVRTDAEQGDYERLMREAAAREGLGAHRGGHASSAPARNRGALGVAVLAAVLAAAVVAALAGGYGPLAMVPGLPLVLCLFSLLGHLFFGGRTGDARLEQYEGGLVVRLKGLIRVVRYADTKVLDNTVRRTQYGQPLSVTYSFGLTDTEGRNLVVGSVFTGGEIWGPLLRQDSARAQLPGALARLDAGERLDFGLVWLTATELGSGRASAPWPAVHGVELADGTLTVRAEGRRGPLVVAPTRYLANTPLLLTLMETLRVR
ncbi:DUF6585 family protein [Streptomyces roseolus]|uniref:DUF6585 family protein n=1 Tax=Streptomyces roseolus TaxID=67358 RepID=UPI001672BA1C|nr:DUF6585 family protein [Streptomyces roseolus]GGR27449.1 hypothetical protein GCM10010282_19920 [Streptomyces roseolus]